jgi:hypothetical protein
MSDSTKPHRVLIIPNQTYNVPESAEALGVSTISVWRFIYRGYCAVAASAAGQLSPVHSC